MNDWAALYIKFAKLSLITKTHKHSSYEMRLTFTVHDMYSAELGCYDVGGWPRTLHITANSEENLFERVNKKVYEALLEVLYEFSLLDYENEAKYILPEIAALLKDYSPDKGPSNSILEWFNS